MKISVKILFGEERPFEVSSEMSVSDLKMMVTEQCNIPLSKQKLLLNGRALVDSKKLGEYNIQEGTKLNVFVCQTTSESEAQEVDENISDHELYSLVAEKLKGFWSDEDAQKVAEEFVRSLNDNLATMSLDDLERLATELMEEEDPAENAAEQDANGDNITDVETEGQPEVSNQVEEIAEGNSEDIAD